MGNGGRLLASAVPSNYTIALRFPTPVAKPGRA